MGTLQKSCHSWLHKILATCVFSHQEDDPIMVVDEFGDTFSIFNHPIHLANLSDVLSQEQALCNTSIACNSGKPLHKHSTYRYICSYVLCDNSDNIINSNFLDHPI